MTRRKVITERAPKKHVPMKSLVVETYYQQRRGHREIYISPAPSCFNGAVNVVRYRVTVEEIVEPEAVAESLRKLWRECDNCHHWHPLEAAAAMHGVTLDRTERSVDAKRARP